jgi:hypothetical protein
MRTGEVEANLLRLNEEARLSHVDDLIARKLAGPEQSILDDGDVAFHRSEYERLVAELEEAYRAGTLPDGPSVPAIGSEAAGGGDGAIREIIGIASGRAMSGRRS